MTRNTNSDESDEEEPLRDEVLEVRRRLEAMHGDMVEDINERQLTPEEAGRAAAYREAISLIDSALTGGLDLDEDDFEDVNAGMIDRLVSISRRYRGGEDAG